MYFSSESLLVILFVGFVGGWLAGQIVQGTGFGSIGDMAIGSVGAIIGNWTSPRLGTQLGLGIISAIIDATIGATVLLLVSRLVRGDGRWNSGSGVGWSRRWRGRW
jgi:uncharacterized membrane protein YeaQ/YmgE (transglycosylase-associated protein family)